MADTSRGTDVAPDFDTRLRSEVMRFLAVRTNDGLDSISR